MSGNDDFLEHVREMSDEALHLFHAIRRLNTGDQLAIADGIYCLLANDENWRPSDEVMEEIHRRIDEHDRDPSSAISSEEMFARIEKLKRSLSTPDTP